MKSNSITTSNTLTKLSALICIAGAVVLSFLLFTDKAYALRQSRFDLTLEDGGVPITSEQTIRLSIWTHGIEQNDHISDSAINTNSDHYGEHWDTINKTPNSSGVTAIIFDTDFVEFPSFSGANIYLRVEYKGVGEADSSYILYSAPEIEDTHLDYHPMDNESVSFYEKMVLNNQFISTHAKFFENMEVGRNATASGFYAFAAGDGVIASGNRSIAMGDENTASGIDSFAIGDTTLASGNQSVSMGKDTVASGNKSFAGGRASTAAGNYSFAFGEYVSAIANKSFAIGEGTIASGDKSFAGGSGSVASGDYSFAFGLNVTASGNKSTAFGEDLEASGLESFATGDGNVSSGNQSVAMGKDTTASNYRAFAVGQDTIASGAKSVAMGDNNTASGNDSFAMGQNSTAGGHQSVAMGDTVVVTGNDAFVFGENITNSTSNSFAVGYEQIDFHVMENAVKIPNDSTKLYFGSGDDVSIMYDGTNMVLNSREVGTGSFEFQGGNVELDEGLSVADGRLTFLSGGTSIFNQLGEAIHLRIESDNEENMFFVNGITDRIGIGTSAPETELDVIGTISGKTLVTSGNIFSSGSVSRYGFFYAYDTVADTNLSAGSYTTIDNDQVVVSDSDFYSEDSGTVTIQRSGLYRVDAKCGSKKPANTRELAECAIHIGGAIQNNLTCAMYARETSGVSGTSCAINGLINLSATDQVTLRYKPDHVNIDPADNEQSLTLEFVR